MQERFIIRGGPFFGTDMGNAHLYTIEGVDPEQYPWAISREEAIDFLQDTLRPSLDWVDYTALTGERRRRIEQRILRAEKDQYMQHTTLDAKRQELAKELFTWGVDMLCNGAHDFKLRSVVFVLTPEKEPQFLGLILNVWDDASDYWHAFYYDTATGDIRKLSYLLSDEPYRILAEAGYEEVLLDAFLTRDNWRHSNQKVMDIRAFAPKE